MEIFPQAQNKNLEHLKFSFPSYINNKPICRCQSHCISFIGFRLEKCSGFVLRSSYDGGGLILDQGLETFPLSVELDPISDESQFDRVIGVSERLQEPVVLLWLASWCRKCIYLKPKLEKLAADYYPRIKFYSVDVNKVPHKMVARAGVTKMPTIQIWRNGEKEGEVIGGHSAHLVVKEVRELIENVG